ncbi:MULTISPECIES: DHA2 family efflux MFS transporter permease subunit [unclassified Corynebacterium]|uniref:DHA2 family efflux MFS transporter permease subunit n=1 Tax=unclassified Corynebacterium TaxID=2624378 RepID=UPI00163D95CE|nr:MULTISPECIES: DHA2 family efflux MFS transporter permease subunit [unclassified Corynebacterium]
MSESQQQDSGNKEVNVGLLIGILVSAAFVVILNETTLSVALPVLMEEFNVTASVAQWLTTAFMLTMAVVIPMTGFIMQRFTLRSIYIAALVSFLIGTAIAVVAPNFAVLLVARVVQATGTALVMPLLMTTIMRLVPVERRGSVFGLVTVVIAAAPALGPTFSGIVLESLGWRWIFGLVIPLVLVALVVGAVQVRNFEEPTRPYLDVVSVMLSAVGFSVTLYGIAGMSELPHGVPWDRVAFMVIGLAVLFVFFRRQLVMAHNEQSTGKAPLLNLAPLSSREYVLSMVFMLVAFSMLFGFIILMPLYAQNVLGMSQKATGLVSLPGGLIMAVMGPVVGRLYDQRGARPLIIPGAIVLFLSMLGFANVSRTQSWFEGLGDKGALVHLIILAILLNMSVGFMLTPLMSNALAAVPDRLASHGQAILNTFQQVAGGAGTAIFVAVMTYGSSQHAKSLGLGDVAAPSGGGHGAPAGDAGAAAGPAAEQMAKITADIVGHGIEVAFWFGVVVSAILALAIIALKIEVPSTGNQQASAMH